jgi:septal ring factor EnvC (AmiA/AmiB activator)
MPAPSALLRGAGSLPAMGAIAAAALTCLAATPLHADEAEHLKAIEQDLAAGRAEAENWSHQAKALREEILALRNESIAVARKAQEQEAALSAVESKLAELRGRELGKRAILAARHGALTRTLGALQRIALRPPESLLAAPGMPIDTARSALLLSHAVPEVERRVEVVRGEVEELRLLRAKIQSEQEALALVSRGLDAERERLDALIGRKRELREQAAGEAAAARARAERLAAEAEDLRDLIERLERERTQRAIIEKAQRLARERAEHEARATADRLAREAAEWEAELVAQAAREAAERDQAEQAARQSELGQALERTRREAEDAEAAAREAEQVARLDSQPTISALEKPANVRSFPISPTVASLIMPARGSLVARYGEAGGGAGPASKGITIAARSSAQVVAPFDGQVAYAGHFRGYGQILIIEHGGRYHTLLAGLERIDAVVGQWVLAGEPVGIMGGMAGLRAELYFELRRSGQPINPLPWLATTSDKVQG